jgi:hypothetical protein
MDKELKNFIDNAKNIKMSGQERVMIRAKMASLPIPSPFPVTKSPYFSGSHFWTLGKALVAACLIVVLGGGSLSYAAENTLPGDLLYPMKVSFNEEVIGAMKFTPEAKIVWQGKRVERRLSEIEALKGKNRLDENRKNQIETNLNKHERDIERIKDGHNIDTEPIIIKVKKGRENLGRIISQEAKENGGINHPSEQNRMQTARPLNKERMRE